MRGARLINAVFPISAVYHGHPSGSFFSTSLLAASCGKARLALHSTALIYTIPTLPYCCVKKYRYQDEDTTSPPEHSSPRLPADLQPPELVQVSEKNISQIENVHGFVSHSHISPMKVESLECIFDGPSPVGGEEVPAPAFSTLYSRSEALIQS
ncbi:hypothetical protein MHYP_G00333970 [Metynnis hypsauchen]